MFHHSIVRLFNKTVKVMHSNSDDELPPEWAVRRRYTEFYVLESKLCEFHGSLSPAHLPPKKLFGRNWEFLNSKREELQRFLQVCAPNLSLLYKFHLSRSNFDNFRLN